MEMFFTSACLWCKEDFLEGERIVVIDQSPLSPPMTLCQKCVKRLEDDMRSTEELPYLHQQIMDYERGLDDSEDPYYERFN